MRNKEKHFQNRDVQDVLNIIGGRWRGAILASLCDSPKRFNELKRDLETITPRTLTKELKFLEMNKLTIREEGLLLSTPPLYFITTHGLSIEPLIKQIVIWGQMHRKVIFGTAGEAN